jgi:hypothetical protein
MNDTQVTQSQSNKNLILQSVMVVIEYILHYLVMILVSDSNLILSINTDLLL